MHVWAIADLHLSFGVPNKKMDIFGPRWVEHEEKVKNHWIQNISPDDLILLAGDFSWGKKFEEVQPDLEWLHQLPGTKVMIRGNHDYWWSSPAKVRAFLPDSIHIIQNDAFEWNGIAVAGSRLWDTLEYNFNDYVIWEGKGIEPEPGPAVEGEITRILNRELNRLELSLQKMPHDAKIRIAMTHYPPIGPNLKPSTTSQLLEKYHINICVFGHVHSMDPSLTPFKGNSKIRYHMTACDYLDSRPLKIL